MHLKHNYFYVFCCILGDASKPSALCKKIQWRCTCPAWILYFICRYCTAKNSETILKKICPFVENYELFLSKWAFFSQIGGWFADLSKMLILRKKLKKIEKNTDFSHYFPSTALFQLVVRGMHFLGTRLGL